jgi:uncharacterized protein (TIGR02996 family)
MPEIETLFANVYAHPEDDTYRWVLADALQEKGDPRGTFISVQLLHHEGRSTRRARGQESALLHAQRRLLHGALADHVIPKATRFSRGFPARVRYAHYPKSALHDADLAEWNTVESLDGVPVGSHLLERAELTSLTELHARWEPLMRRTRPLPSLKTLDASWEPPTDLEAVLACFPNLERFATYGGEDVESVWNTLRRIPSRIAVCELPVTDGSLIAMARRWDAERSRTLVMTPYSADYSRTPASTPTPVKIVLSPDRLELISAERAGYLLIDRVNQLRDFAGTARLPFGFVGDEAFRAWGAQLLG